MWANIYNALVKDGVKFPKGWKGFGACYGGLCMIDDTLQEYKVNPAKTYEL